MKKTIDNKFQLGEGATVCYFTDCHAYTVIDISPSGKTIKIQRDDVKLTNPEDLTFHTGGFCANVIGEQKYTYTRNIHGNIRTARLNKKGKWVSNGNSVIPGRFESYDYNFYFKGIN